MAVLAQIAVGRTFVDVSAVIGQTNLLVALGTDAHERADEVLASKFAIVGRRGAFVHVCLHQKKIRLLRRLGTDKFIECLPWQWRPSGAKV
jgi:hypothetical protein